MEYNSFIYLWIDNKNNKFYIGSHFGNVNDGYLFGGIDIKSEYSIRPQDFERIILSYHLVDNHSDIRKIEKEYLIKYDVENQEFRVHHDAVDFLSKLEGKIGIIAVCGKYRTGKSYLLNKLFMETLNNE